MILTLDEHNAKVKALQAEYERLAEIYDAKAVEHRRAQKEADDAFDGMDKAYHIWMNAMQARNLAVDAHFAKTRGDA